MALLRKRRMSSKVTESDAVDVVEIALKRHMSDVTTRAMSLIALLKLSSRFPPCSERIREIIIQQKGSLVLELQQRSIEFISIIQKHQNIKPALVERMPVLDEAAYLGKKASSSQVALSTEKTSHSNSSRVPVSLPNGVTKPPAAPLLDLLDLTSDDVPAPSSSGDDFLQDLLGIGSSPNSSLPGASQAPPTGGADILLDLLSIGTPPPASSPNIVSTSQANMSSVSPLEALSPLSSLANSAQASQSSILGSVKGTMDQAKHPGGVAPVMDLLDGLSSSPSLLDETNSHYPTITAYHSDTLKITFSFSKQPGKPQITSIQATFTNLSSNTYTDFVFQAAVPKFIQLHLDPASSNVLPANGSGSITQSLSINNSQHGQKALAMRIRINYKMNNENKKEDGQINNFPPGL